MVQVQIKVWWLRLQFRIWIRQLLMKCQKTETFSFFYLWVPSIHTEGRNSEDHWCWTSPSCDYCTWLFSELLLNLDSYIKDVTYTRYHGYSLVPPIAIQQAEQPDSKYYQLAAGQTLQRAVWYRKMFHWLWQIWTSNGIDYPRNTHRWCIRLSSWLGRTEWDTGRWMNGAGGKIQIGRRWEIKCDLEICMKQKRMYKRSGLKMK